MKRVPRALGALLLALGCGSSEREAPGVPVAHLLTPESQHAPTSAFSPDGKEVAYWFAGDTTWELRVANADLSDARTLATSGGWFDPIIWSPDGKSLAFTSTAASYGDVWVVSLDSPNPVARQVTHAAGLALPEQWYPGGKGLLAYGVTEQGGAIRTHVLDLATGASRPLLAEQRTHYATWSPDGSKIAYTVVEGSRTTLWIADSSGANPRQLSQEGLEQFDGNPSPWSPDGSRLLYVSRRTGFTDIWTIAVADGRTTQLTRDIRNDGQPAWSPDGRWVAFISERGHQTDVWLVPAEGGEERRVTDDEAAESSVQWIDGHTLAYRTGKRTGTLSLLSAGDGTERQLTPDSIQISTFDISPDGREVVYGAGRQGAENSIQIIPIDGGPARILVPGPADNGDPYWSPDGRQVLFFSNRSGSGDLWVVNREGGAPRALTNWPSEEVDGEWAADSKSVYFLSGRGGGAFFDLYQVAATGGGPKRLTTTGAILNVEPSRGSNDVFLTGIGKTAGRFVLSRIRPDGGTEMLWDRNNVNGLSHRRISPTGDSLAVQLDEPGGGFSSVIVSVHDRTSHPILAKREAAGAWSPDGTQLIYYFGSPNADLGILNLADGKTRRLTTTPEAEGSTQWTPDGQSIVVLRSFPKRRIATVDVAGLTSR